MAYMNQEKKKVIASKLKPVLKKYGLKGTLSVRHNSCLILNISEGKPDILFDYILNSNASKESKNCTLRDGYLALNPYRYYQSFSRDLVEMFDDIFAALKSADWYDKSDSMTDYFDTAYYMSVSVGKFGKPYKVVA